MKKNFIILGFCILTTLFFNEVFAQRRRVRARKARRPASAQKSQAAGPIEVKGQTRSLNMLLRLQGENEAIDFIELREDYEKEIKKQNY